MISEELQRHFARLEDAFRRQLLCAYSPPEQRTPIEVWVTGVSFRLPSGLQIEIRPGRLGDFQILGRGDKSLDLQNEEIFQVQIIVEADQQKRLTEGL